MTQTYLTDIQSIFQLRSADAGWFAENIWCDDCKTYFTEDIQYLGHGRYLAFCWVCERPEPFSNADIFTAKCEDNHFPLVKQLVKYYRDNKIEMVIASVNNGWLIDGHHRIAAAVELGMSLVIVDDREEPIIDTPDQWVSRSPAFA